MTSALEFGKTEFKKTHVLNQLKKREHWTQLFQLGEPWSIYLYLYEYKCSCKRCYVTVTPTTRLLKHIFYSYSASTQFRVTASPCMWLRDHTQWTHYTR